MAVNVVRELIDEWRYRALAAEAELRRLRVGGPKRSPRPETSRAASRSRYRRRAL